jgi:hypothetical protein
MDTGWLERQTGSVLQHAGHSYQGHSSKRDDDARTYVTVFMNHEFGGGSGIVRDHGVTGAFVSPVDDSSQLAESSPRRGSAPKVFTWDAGLGSYVDSTGQPEAQFQRFCSTDLPPLTVVYNPRSRKGFRGRMFTNGQENGGGGHPATRNALNERLR